jgi:hypothetical protein
MHTAVRVSAPSPYRRRCRSPAVLPLNPGNIASALVNGTTLVLGSFVVGGQHVVDGIVTAQQILATALATQPPAASATAFSANVSRAAATDVPKLSRKTAMVAVSPPTDTANPLDTVTAAASSQATSEQKAVSSQNEIAKAGADEAESAAAKDDTSAAADNPDRPTAQSSKPYTEEKRADSPKHASPKNATAKADNGSQSEGANQK